MAGTAGPRLWLAGQPPGAASRCGAVTAELPGARRALVESHTGSELLMLQALAEFCWASTPASRSPLPCPAPVPGLTEAGIPGMGTAMGGRGWHGPVSVSAQAASPGAVRGRLVALHLLPHGSAVCTNTLDAESDQSFCFVTFLMHGFSRVHFRAGAAQTPSLPPVVPLGVTLSTKCVFSTLRQVVLFH